MKQVAASQFVIPEREQHSMPLPQAQFLDPGCGIPTLTSWPPGLESQSPPPGPRDL